MKTFFKLSEAIQWAKDRLFNYGYVVQTEKWQGIPSPDDMNEVMNVSVLSSSGQLVSSHNGFINEINTKSFDKGFYFLLIKTKTASYSKKFIVE